MASHEGTTSQPAVSVVVAVYNPGPNIDGLLASLDEQTLPTSDYEVVLVDDGSTDETPRRLQQYASERPNVVVHTIPNSGWPGRPRNVGVDLSHGEYVFFADHDDAFWPDALERLVATARANDADVVYPKVVRKGLSTPYWELARRDVPVADVVADQLIVSRSVHKLFRRSFLLEHGIRFPEGRVRLEDHHVMGQVLSKRPRVSVLASSPGYVWIHRPDGTNTSTTPVDLNSYFGYVDESVALLLHGADEQLRRQVAEHSLARIFLPLRADTWVERSPSEQSKALAAVADFLDAHVPAELERELPRLKQWSVQAVHDGDVDLYDGLVQLRISLRQTVTADAVSWSQDDRLAVEATAVVTDADGDPVRLHVRGDELVLPPAMGAPADVTIGHDVGEPAVRPDASKVARADPHGATLRDVDLGTGELTLRHRATGVEWPLHGGAESIRVPLDAGSSDGVPEEAVGLGMRLQADIDPLHDYFGNDLQAGIWDVMARVDLLGERQVPRVKVPEQFPLPPQRQVGSREVQVYRTTEGTLALKVRDPEAERAARARVTAAQWSGDTLHLGIALPVELAGAGAEVVLRVRGSQPDDVLVQAPVSDGSASLPVPQLPAGTLVDAWARRGGSEQRLVHDVASEPAPSAQGWRAYATAHGSFSLKRGAAPEPPRRSGVRRWLGR